MIDEEIQCNDLTGPMTRKYCKSEACVNKKMRMFLDGNV